MSCQCTIITVISISNLKWYMPSEIVPSFEVQGEEMREVIKELLERIRQLSKKMLR